MAPRRTTLPPTVRQVGGVLLGAGLIAVLAVPVPALADGDTAAGLDDLRTDLDEILNDPALEGATSGMLVHSRTEGDTLYSVDEQTPLIPASNAKLFTGAAALATLGEDYRFQTSVVSEQEPDAAGVLDADVHLVGTGDPTLTPAAYAELAEEVADAGVTTVTGDLLADDTWFDEQRLAPDWASGDEPFAYAAQVSALTVATDDDRHDTGVTEVTASPGDSPGEPLDVDAGVASGYVEVENYARTGAPGRDTTLEVTRLPDTNTIELRGTLPVDADSVSNLRTVDEPTDYATHVLAGAFDEAGVELEGELDRGAAPADGTELATRDSAALAELMVPFLKFSNNPHAEILVKTLGRVEAGDGTWEAGLNELDAALQEMGLDTQDLTLTDGSGLSRSNTLTAQTLLELFETAPEQEWYDTWAHSLPIAGEPDPLVGGTLSSRMVDTPAAGNVTAKTGTLTGVSALSGYVTGAGGEELVFAVLNNDHSGPAPTEVQDAVAIRLAEFDRAAAVDTEPTRLPQVTEEPDNAADPAVDPGTVECSWIGVC